MPHEQTVHAYYRNSTHTTHTLFESKLMGLTFITNVCRRACGHTGCAWSVTCRSRSHDQWWKILEWLYIVAILKYLEYIIFSIIEILKYTLAYLHFQEEKKSHSFHLDLLKGLHSSHEAWGWVPTTLPQYNASKRWSKQRLRLNLLWTVKSI